MRRTVVRGSPSARTWLMPAIALLVVTAAGVHGWASGGPVGAVVAVLAGLALLVLGLRIGRSLPGARSARSLERAQQVAGVGSWEVELSSDRQVWSRRTFEILGLDPASARPSAAAFFRVVHPDDLDGVRSAMRRATDDGLLDVVYRVVRDDGAVRVVHARAEAEPGDGRSNRWLGTVQDITDRERRTATLAETQDTLRRVLAATNDGWWTEDLRTGEVFHSDRWWELHGYEPGAFPDDQHLWRRLTHPDDVDRIAREFTQAEREGVTAFTSETRVLHRAGHVVPILMRALVDYDESGRAIRLSAATTDLTTSRQAERAKDAFISTVSHELRTPLTAIGGSLETLRAGVVGELPPAAQQMVDLAVRNTVRLRALVDDLLDLDRMLAGQTHFDVAAHPLEPVILRVLEENQQIALVHGVRFTFERTQDRLVAELDPRRVGQVLVNYLSNAAKFAPPGSTIEVRARRTGAAIRTEVIDQGPGLPVEFAPQAFERFAQADSTDKRSQGGTGLGLAICREIIERLGGTVGFESRPGRTSFYFDLPAVDEAAGG